MFSIVTKDHTSPTRDLATKPAWKRARPPTGFTTPDESCRLNAQQVVDLVAKADSPYTTVTQVLHWYQLGEPLSEGANQPGYGFVATFGSTDAPYQAS